MAEGVSAFVTPAFTDGKGNISGFGSGSVTASHAGTGYAVGDYVEISGGGSSNAFIRITGIGGGGSVTSFSIVNAGDSYTVSNGLTTTAQTGSGSGLEVNCLSTVGSNSSFQITVGYVLV